MGTVTGSRHLLTAAGSRLLVDCGMFQGDRQLRDLNWKRPEFDPASVNALVLTHAHMDHAGLIPRFVREGFPGKIYCTKATRELVEVILLDSAKLQEEEAQHANRHGYAKHDPALPLYTSTDVQAALTQFSTVEYAEHFSPADALEVTLHNAGHILGSAFVEVAARRDGGTTRVVFSGDIGRYGAELHSDPDPLSGCDALAIESTYGDRVHSETPLVDQIRQPFTDTLRAGGMILIPSFAMARTQLVTLMLGELMSSGAVPRVPVHVDSPMAVAITRIYNKHLLGTELDAGLGTETDSAILPAGTTFAQTVDESKRLNGLAGPRIIIASSGMLTGGRVLHHLERLLPDQKNLVVLVGYQAAGTRGRQLLDGAKSLRMYGRDIEVAARVLSIEGMSGHADSNELMRWFKSGPALPRLAFITHGEPGPATALAERIRAETAVNAVIPKIGDSFDLDAMLGR
ncbi:MAG: MBL fold metallo-hydrolase [Chloroflexota bacterium]|nr:MBL fold metallo-hydrolase [Chloroflexota bacterium]